MIDTQVYGLTGAPLVETKVLNGLWLQLLQHPNLAQHSSKFLTVYEKDSVPKKLVFRGYRCSEWPLPEVSLYVYTNQYIIM